jgi:hypothetical protein
MSWQMMLRSSVRNSWLIASPREAALLACTVIFDPQVMAFLF